MSETPKWAAEAARNSVKTVLDNHGRPDCDKCDGEIADIIAKHSPVEAMEKALRTIQAAFEACDSELYCEENCTANRNDKNFCSCNRRDRFGSLIDAICMGDEALALARGEK